MRTHSTLSFIATIFATLAFATVGRAQLASPNPSQASGAKSALEGKYFQVPQTGLHSTSSTISIHADSSTVNGQTFTLDLPPNAIAGSLKVVLNGHDVSGNFRGTTATLSAQDGLSAVKNVLVATVKVSSGDMASGRWRSMNAPTNKGGANAPVLAMAKSAGTSFAPKSMAIPAASPVCDPVNMCPAWLPPSVRFDTLTKGGAQLNQKPWLQVNGVPVGSLEQGTSTGQYAAAALDRETLIWKDFEWYPNSTQTNQFIQKYNTSDYIVIVGTTSASNGVDAGLDTSAIGGTNFAACNCALPQSYMVIGAGGQTPGTAYENKRSANAFATGLLLEDANGNYNFQSSDIVEYAVEPEDPGHSGNPTLRLTVPENLSTGSERQDVYLANATPGQNGLWLLVLDRTTLQLATRPFGCDGVYDTSGDTLIFQGCGTFYAVGAGNNNIDGAFQSLADALDAVTSDQIVFLQSIGTVGSSNLATTVASGKTNTGFLNFKYHFQPLGGTPLAIAGPNFNNQDNYSFVGYLGARNALAGGATELSTAFPGQKGVLHGTLQRDSNGLYRPAQTSPEQQGMFNDKGGLNDSDFELSIASYQQPVPWPSNSATVLLSGASSIAGQQAAYRFISHWLLAGYYMKTIQGPHQDDLHFFFSGSTNTSINYQTMDPANLQFPTVGTWNGFGCSSINGATCTFQAPGDNGQSTFTTADFNAVKGQVSLEVIYLTNTLQYLVTGSTNLKAVVAAGNANVGLALTAAANTVMGSGMANLNNEQIASKQVTFSWQSLLSTIGGVASVAANLESFGEAIPLYDASKGIWQEAKQISSGVNAIASIVGTVGSGGGIRTTASSLTTYPQPFAPLTTTVGELATQDLQSPIIIGFDSAADNITSDWGRLSVIGPRTTNTSDSTFFAPNQVQQVAAINALTTSAARSFYFSLLPTVYNLHYWSNVAWYGAGSGVFQPSVGSYEDHVDGPGCNAFYLIPNNLNGTSKLGTLSMYQGITYPSIGGTSSLFTQDYGNLDFWVIDGVVSKAGSQSTNIAVIDSDLATNLFSLGQLNIPMLQLFSANGPMASVTKDASADGISGWSNGNICDASNPNYNYSGNSGVSGPPSGTAKLLTTTALIGPMSGVTGQDMSFTAKVVASSTGQAATSGSVYISVDGKVVGNPAVGTNGAASYTVAGGLALGNHTIQADYAPGTGYEGSSATPATFVVYSESADISVAVPSSTLNVSYTASSSPVTLQIGSIAGLTGNVALSCSGLPAGLACTFSSQSMTLAANGNLTATVQIGPNTTARADAPKSSFGRGTLAVLMIPIVGMGILRKKRPVTKLVMLTILAAGLTTLTLTGCSGGSVSPTPSRETGPKTITINANVGSVARSVGMNINIQ